MERDAVRAAARMEKDYDKSPSGLIYQSLFPVDTDCGENQSESEKFFDNGMLYGRSRAFLHCEICFVERELFLQYGMRYLFDAYYRYFIA